MKYLKYAFLMLIAIGGITFFTNNNQALASATVSSWWPVNNAQVSGTQPFKGVVSGLDVSQYSMFWSVDNGTYNSMYNSYTDAPHKEAQVNVGGWTWKGQGPYTVTYIAQNFSGQELGRTSYVIYNTAAPANQLATPTPVVAPVITKPLEKLSLFVDPNSNAKRQADAWRSSRPADAQQMDKVAKGATAKWLGGWNTNITSDVSQYVSQAQSQGKVPVMVAYNIPQRDCGGYSAGGTTPDAYLAWIRGLANGIGSNKAIVVVEPDALANIDCLNATDQATRYSLLSQAVTILKANTGTFVYLDAGNPRWKTTDVMASRLNNANIKAADGFSLNVSNFIGTSENATYGQALSQKINNKHFVIDTSRNGSGPTSDNQWCNPAGRALGQLPTTQVSDPLIDAYLWIKAPGESDGTCNGGPSAGAWWSDYALGLAQRANY